MDVNLTPDGYDSHLTVNNLAHMLLANRLLPLMRKTSTMDGVKTGDVRIVGQSSELHRGDKFQDAMFENEEEFKLLSGGLFARMFVMEGEKGLMKCGRTRPYDELCTIKSSCHPVWKRTRQECRLRFYQSLLYTSGRVSSHPSTLHIPSKR
jgi:hypothetical protein